MKQLDRKDVPEVSGGYDDGSGGYDVVMPIDPIGTDYPQNPITPPTFDHQTA